MMRDSIRDPREIIKLSFEIVADEVDFSRFPKDLVSVVERIVHACAMPDVAGALGGLEHLEDFGGNGRGAANLADRLHGGLLVIRRTDLDE